MRIHAPQRQTASRVSTVNLCWASGGMDRRSRGKSCRQIHTPCMRPHVFTQPYRCMLCHTPVHTQTPVGPCFPWCTVSVSLLMWSLFLVVEAQWPQWSQMLCEVDRLSGGERAACVVSVGCLFLKMATCMIWQILYSRVCGWEKLPLVSFLSYCSSTALHPQY